MPPAFTLLHAPLNYSVFNSASDRILFRESLSISRAVQSSWESQIRSMPAFPASKSRSEDGRRKRNCVTVQRDAVREDGERSGTGDGGGQPVRGNFPHLLPNNSHGNEVTATVSGE